MGIASLMIAVISLFFGLLTRFFVFWSYAVDDRDPVWSDRTQKRPQICESRHGILGNLPDLECTDRIHCMVYAGCIIAETNLHKSSHVPAMQRIIWQMRSSRSIRLLQKKRRIMKNTEKKKLPDIGRYMALIVLIIAALALFAPDTCLWIQTSWVNYLLMIVMFGMGLTLKLEDFKLVFTRPKDIIIGCIAQFTIMPSLAFGLGKIFQLDAALLAGVVLVGTCPAEPPATSLPIFPKEMLLFPWE